MSTIIVLAGQKQTGKSSGAAYLFGQKLAEYGVIPSFKIMADGKLIVPNKFQDGTEGEGELDPQSKHPAYLDFAAQFFDPIVSVHNFADELKRMCYVLYDIPLHLSYGTDEDKETPSQYTWDDFRGVLSPATIGKLKSEGKLKERMKVREVLQNVGTFVRSVNPDAFVNACQKSIDRTESEVSVVADCRFDNELRYFKNKGAILIKFIKNITEGDSHESENGLKTIPDSWYDLIINKDEVTIAEKNQMIQRLMDDRGISKVVI